MTQSTMTVTVPLSVVRDAFSNQPFIKTEQIDDLRSTIKFVSEPIESIQARVAEPTKPNISTPSHGFDEAGAAFGMCGEEVEIYIHSGINNAPGNDLLMRKFKDFLMAAKLVAGHEVDKQLAAMRNRHAVYTRQKLESDKSYKHKMREYEDRKVRLAYQHEAAKDSVTKQWRKIIKSLEALARKYPDLSAAAHNDYEIMTYLARRGVVTIVDGHVTEVNVGKLMKFRKDQIAKVLNLFPEKADKVCDADLEPDW